MTAPHLTATGPDTANEWEALIASAPRHEDEYGRTILQVCTAADGRAIHCTLEYAESRLVLERQREAQAAALAGRAGAAAKALAEKAARHRAALDRAYLATLAREGR